MVTRPIILGRYSPSQNGIVVSPKGIALCLAGGAMATIQTNPKFSSSMTYEKCPVCCDTIAAQKNTTPSRSRLGLINAYQGGYVEPSKLSIRKAVLLIFF